jgi:hypothetical protein
VFFQRAAFFAIIFRLRGLTAALGAAKLTKGIRRRILPGVRVVPAVSRPTSPQSPLHDAAPDGREVFSH